MKSIFSILLFLTPVLLYAQAATSTDSSAIKEACSNYVGGYYNADFEKVSKGVHPELVKRIVGKWNGTYKIGNMGASELIAAAKNSKKPADPNPQEPFKLDIVIYDIAQDIATVKIMSNKMKFFDYAQLAKMNGEWKIINVLWALTQ